MDVTPEDEETNTNQVSLKSEKVSEPNQVNFKLEAEVAALDAELLKSGEKAFKKCKSCHQIGAGAKNKTGPHLNGIFVRKLGGIEGFKYSKLFKAMKDEGRVWDEESMAAFLAAPKKYAKGTKMSFSGFKKDEDIVSTIEYLKSFQTLN